MASKFEKALNVVREEIRNDEELFHAYQANIAMAFVDEYKRNNSKYKNDTDIHEIANTAAKVFINMWIRDQKIIDTMEKNKDLLDRLK